MTESFRIFDPAAVAAASRSPWWWATADNPACLPGCIENHDPDEFKVSGALICLLGTFVDHQGYRLVDVYGTQSTDDRVPDVVTRAEYEVLVIGPVEALSARAAHELAVALSRAAVLMGEVA